MEQRQRRLGLLSPTAQRLTQIIQRGLPVRSGAKGQRAGGANALVPVIGQNQGRIVRHSVDVSRRRLLIIVGRTQMRRRGCSAQSSRVPEGRITIEEGGHFFIAEVKRAVRRNSIRTQQDQLARVHVLDLAKRRRKI